MKQIRHIIWDWNGTILDDSWLCVDIINKMLCKRNMPQITEQQYSEIFQFPAKTFYEKIGFDFNHHSIENLSNEYIKKYEKEKFKCNTRSCFHKLQPILNQNNIKQSILSAYVEKYLNNILVHHNMHDIFTHISGLNNCLAESKIKNGIALIEKINIPKDECLFIGDTIHDLETAEAMGIECVLIPSGHNSEERLKNKTDKIITNLTDIINICSING
jgi:phosphoglycolate phosphatase